MEKGIEEIILDNLKFGRYPNIARTDQQKIYEGFRTQRYNYAIMDEEEIKYHIKDYQTSVMQQPTFDPDFDKTINTVEDYLNDCIGWDEIYVTDEEYEFWDETGVEIDEFGNKRKKYYIIQFT